MVDASLQNILIISHYCSTATNTVPNSGSSSAEQGHHEHCVMKNASFTPTECLLSCLSVHAVFWHDAFSFGSWETRNTLTSLCQTPPSSQGEALWWPSWQWQTDNGWMLHFTSPTFLWKCSFFPLNCPLSRRERGQRLTEKNNFKTLQGHFTWRHMG